MNDKRNTDQHKIDFVIIWVDGGDPEWMKSKDYWMKKENGVENPEPLQIDAADIRYRDWNLLHYWFRAVEKYAPWVNQVHFVTCGQLPEWMNPQAPKLHLVDHKDYIPHKYLPVFSSHPIELNLHRIPGLAEHFVYFCDDFFLTDYVKEEDFFQHGLPCDNAEERPIPFSERVLYNSILINDLVFASQHFDRMKVRRKYFGKWFPLNSPMSTFHNLVFSIYRSRAFFGLNIHHLPMAYRKSTLEEVWEADEKLLDETSSHKFRSDKDVSQCVFKYWQLMTGNFTPYNKRKFGHSYPLAGNVDQIVKAIRTHKYKSICLNDTDISDFEETKKRLQQAFEAVLPEKSSFEL